MKISSIPKSGRKGSVVYVNSRHGKVVRQYVCPGNPRTPRQQGHRDNLAAIRRRWRTLGAGPQAAWCRVAANSVRQGGCCLGHTSSTGKGLEILTSLSGDKSMELRSKAKAPPLGAPGLKSPVSFSAKVFGDSVLWPAPV